MRRVGLIGAVLGTLALAGCGSQRSSEAERPAAARAPTTPAGSPALQAHPQAIEPVAGSATPSGSAAGGTADVSVGPPSGQLAEPVSETVIRQELAQSGLTASMNRATLTSNGLAIAPVNAPGAVQEVIAAGNEIAHLPYRFGGGHGTFEDTAYDCSGSLSFVFAAAGLLNTTVTSGELMNWGDPGPGKWITVFASPGHTFMYIAGLRFDTVALAETGSRWSGRSADEPDLSSFAIRHPPGL